VSAVPGGVPPGTPLYGAYGQPLPPATAGPPQGRPYPYPPSDYTPPMHSPTGSSFAPYDEKDAGRRRTRPPEEEHSSRPPPPNYPIDDDPRRRSPISVHSNGTPPTGYHPYQQSPYDRERPSSSGHSSPGRPIQPQPPLRNPQAGPQSQMQQPQSQLPPQPKGQPQAPPSGYPNPMSLDNLMGPGPRGGGGGAGGVNEIDRSMLGRLNRRS
jgi:hypothetical protein